MKIFVTASPGAKQERVEQVDATHFSVRVKALPKAGAANRAVERAIADFLGVAPTRVRITRGHTIRRKTVEVS